MGVECLVVVDDEWVPTSQSLIAAAQPTQSIAGQRYDPVKHGDYADWLKEIWPEIKPNELIGLRLAAAQKAPELLADPLDVLIYLGSAAGTFKALLPERWEEKQTEILKRHGAEKILVLFDRFINGSSETGEGLLAEYMSAHDSCNAAMLTSQATREEELERQREVAKAINVEPERVLLVSKEHLTADRCAEFADFLRHTANARNLRTIRDRLLELLAEGQHAAAERLASMPLRVLEDVVLRSSRVEGAYEPDTFIRAHAIEVAHEVRQALAQSGEQSGALAQAIREARKLAEASFLDDQASRAEAERLLARERFQTPETVNAGGLPVANGDVFRITGQLYVLLEQPCDLVMRDDVSASRHHQHAKLVPLRPATESSDREEERRWLLPEYDPWSSGARLAAAFSGGTSLPLRLLDLCAFNGDGEARIDTDSEAPAIEPLTPGLQRRFGQLLAFARDLLAVWGSVPETATEARARLLQVDELQGRVDGTVLSWPIERVGRLSNPVAALGLTARTLDENRPVSPHDLSTFAQR